MSTPARNASVHKTGRIGRFASLVARSSARSTVLAACGALLVAGCNQVGTGLSSNLPPAGGGGLLSFVSVSMPDAIAGRTYSKVAVTSVETQSKTNFPISPAIASGTAPLASCTVTGGSLPPGMNAALTIDPTGSGCLISGTPSAGDAGNTYQFIIQALDSNSPPRAAAQTFSMKVRPEFTVTAPSAVVGGALPAGVQGRSYGQIAGSAAAFTATTTLSATNGNGPVGAKNYCALTVTPALASLTMTQVSGTNNCMLQGSGGVLAAAGSYKVSIALTDNPIVDPETNLAAVPANTIAGASNANLNVGSPLKVVAQADGVSATPPAAVQGRAYGTGSGCSGAGGACLPLTYVATGGLPSVEPADTYLFTDSGLAATGLTCAASAPSTVAKTTCSGTAGAPGTSSFSVTVDDAGNLATPGGSASGTASTISGLSITVDSTLSLAVSPDPAANPAVQNTAYGIGTGCTGAGGNCVAPTYTPTGGLGSYSFSVTGTPPAGITCAANGGNTAVVCSGTASATAATSTFGVSASDVANASSPSASASPVSKTLTVNGALTLTPPVSVPTAVNGRAFGIGTGCSPSTNCAAAVFTVSGGQGTYAATASIVSSPGAWTCPLSGSQYNCSSASVSAGTMLSITASDGASATTPGQTTASASVAITVNPALLLTPPATVNDAVTGRPYGTGTGCGGSCSPLQYTLTGGLGTYGTPALTAGPNTFSCTGTTTYSCSIASVSGSGTQTLSMSIPDSSNASTPTATATDTSKSINIDAKVALANANLGATWPDAVQNRTYAGSGFTADQFAATGGIGAYTFLAPTGFPTGFTCITAATTDTCSATAVGTAGSYSPQITVHDVGNASTPQSTTTTDMSSQFTASLTVKPQITVTAPDLSTRPAVTGRPFGSGSGCSSGNCQPAIFTVAGGLGTYASTASVVASPGAWNCTVSGATYNCSSTLVGSPTGSLTIDVADIANSTTPAATTTTDPGSQSTASVTVKTQVTLTAPTGLVLAVNGRSYGVGNNCTGVGGTCAPAAFSVTGGLGTFAAAPASVSGPGTWTCSLSLTIYDCSSASVAGSGAATLTVAAADVANASTPAANTTTDPSSAATANLTVGTALQLSPPGSIPDGVTSRAYGTGTGCLPVSTCAALTYTAANGIGPYSFSFSGFPTGIACTPSGATDSCSAAAVTGAANSYNPQVGVTDSANASTPPSAAVNSPAATLVVHAPLSLAVSPDPAANPAVQNRDYGVTADSGCSGGGGVCQAPTFTPSGGTGDYNITSASLGTPPAGINCPVTNQSTSSALASCSGNPTTVGGPTSFSVSAIDIANASTPAAASASVVATSLTVNTPLSASGPALLPYGLQGYPYPNPADSATVSTLTASNGLAGSYTWIAPGATGCTSGSPGSLPAGITLNAVSGELSGTPTAVSPTAADFLFQPCVADSPNAATPNGTANTSVTLDVLAPYVVIAETGDKVEFFDTFTRADSLIAQPVSTASGSAPYGIAFSPSGRYAYVTLSGTNQLAIFDTITNSQVVGSPISLTGCTAPHGVAATANLILIACNGTGSTVDTVAVVGVTNTGNTSTFSLGTAVSPTSAPTGDEPEGVAISPDGSLGYVTLSNSDQLFVLAISGSSASAATLPGSNTNPFTLLAPAAGTVPMGIAVTLVKGTGTDTVAYIAKQGTGGDDGVEVLTLTGLNAFTDASGQTFSNNSTAVPTYVAVTPDNTRVYVSLSGATANAFAVFDNTIAAPDLVTTPPTALKTSSASPQGVAIPVLPLTPAPTYAVFISENGTGKLAVIDNTSTPAEETASPYGLSGAAPLGIASTPWPQ